MKSFLVCAIAIAADIAAVVSMCLVGCNATPREPQELQWRGTDSHFESTTTTGKPKHAEK
jgi:hypothetical protein